MNSNSQSKGLRPESGTARRKHLLRSLGKWSGERQPHQSAPIRPARPLRAPVRAAPAKESL